MPYLEPVQIPSKSIYISDTTFFEKELIRTWIDVKPGTIFKDINGKSIMVIQTGVANKNEGPDIHNAVLFANGQFISGDIECHIRTRDWFYHGHDMDINYENIILHITAIPDKRDSEWEGLLLHLKPKEFNDGCNLTKGNVSQSFLNTLLALGLDRRSHRVKRYQSNDWKKYVLHDIFKLLGKGGNEENFLLLLKYFQNGMVEQNLINQSINWRHRGIRPNGWPEKRLLIASQLYRIIQQYRERPNQIPTILKTIIPKNLYIEIIGNVLNPLIAATCIIQRNNEMFQSLSRDWLRLKLGYSYGKMENKYAHIFPSSQLKTFSILQGLFELEKDFCNKNHCIVCPLKRKHQNDTPS